MEAEWEKGEVHNCEIKLREHPRRRKAKIRVGCGAGFAGDRTAAALKLLQRVEELDYLVLECLAERTLADRYHLMAAGQKGYDSRILEWMSLLLPVAIAKGVCIITNMGAVDPIGAQKEVMDLAGKLGISMTVSIAYEVPSVDSADKVSYTQEYSAMEGGMCTYLGAAPIVECLERYQPDLIITSRVADAALFLAPMVYELGWDWTDFNQLAQGTLAGHLLECGCQLTGGYFMHPGDIHRDISFEQLLDLSLPFAEIDCGGQVCVAKANDSGGILNLTTCAEQLLYEVGDPSSYITPDVAIDLRDVYFCSLSNDRVRCHGAEPSTLKYPEKLLRLTPLGCGWKGWGEISYGGYKCLLRADAADFLVRSWMDEKYPGVEDFIVSYVIGYDSLKAACGSNVNSSTEHLMEVRLRMDGLFNLKEHAIHFVEEFMALYTNGPAGGGGISTGHKKEILLQKEQMCSYSSMDGVLYCKPHFEQLFKETGSFTKKFHSPSKSADKLELNRIPSKVSQMFSGTQDKCAVCKKTVYPLEKISVEGESYHKTCFKCSYGGCTLTPSSYAALDGILYCKHHFAQLFMEKGSYNHLIKATSMKKKEEEMAATATSGETTPLEHAAEEPPKQPEATEERS